MGGTSLGCSEKESTLQKYRQQRYHTQRHSQQTTQNELQPYCHEQCTSLTACPGSSDSEGRTGGDGASKAKSRAGKVRGGPAVNIASAKEVRSIKQVTAEQARSSREVTG